MNKYWSPWVGYFVCVVAVAASGSPLVAQAGAPSQSNRVIVIGCIKPSASTPNADLVIRDYRGGPSPSFRLSGEPELLKLSVGQTVEIVGSVVASTAGSGPSANIPTFKVEKLQRLSTSCWPSQDGANK